MTAGATRGYAEAAAAEGVVNDAAEATTVDGDEGGRFAERASSGEEVFHPPEVTRPLLADRKGEEDGRCGRASAWRSERKTASPTARPRALSVIPGPIQRDPWRRISMGVSGPKTVSTWLRRSRATSRRRRPGGNQASKLPTVSNSGSPQQSELGGDGLGAFALVERWCGYTC